MVTQTFRRQLLCTRLPHIGVGGSPAYIPSTRHPSLNLFTLTWLPSGPPIAGVVISPGLQWHSGWFSSVALALSAAGVTVVSLDGVGMGHSDNLLGKRGLIRDIADHVAELAAVVDRLAEKLPGGAPVFVLGESSGGLTAALMAFEEVNARVAGYVLCAPALLVKKELLPPKPVVEVVKAMGKVFPSLPVPGEKVGGETWDRAFGDKRYAEISKRDPYVGYGDAMRMGSGAAFMGGMDRIEGALRRGEVELRNLLVLHNKGDVRTEFENSRKFVERVKCGGSKELVEPGGNGHQLFQDSQEVTQDVIEKVVRFVVETTERERGEWGSEGR